jgi:hypothetical protein
VPDVQSASFGQSLPIYLSADHDPLSRFHQWQANLRVLNIREIKTVPYVPLSHPVVERLIGTVPRECLDRVLFWTAADLSGGSSSSSSTTTGTGHIERCVSRHLTRGPGGIGIHALSDSAPGSSGRRHPRVRPGGVRRFSLSLSRALIVKYSHTLSF